MADRVHRVYLWLLAWIALLVGCVLTATTLSRLADCRAGMERRMAEYRSLAEIDAKVRHMETALATWQERVPGLPAPVSVLATNIFGDMKVEMRELPSSNAAPGFVARRMEVTCQNAQFDRAMQLVQRLDGLWPRWVLVHLELKSTDQAGRGSALMRFESISSVSSVVQPQPPESPPTTPLATPTITAEPIVQQESTGELSQAGTAATNRQNPKGWFRSVR